MIPFDDRLDPQVLAALNAPQNTDSVAPLPNPAVEREDFHIPGPENAPDMLMHLIQPANRGDGLAPAILWIHGGGFVSRDLEAWHMIIDDIVLASGALLFAPEYRLAPEHPFPAALNDCYAALEWLASVRDEYQLDRDRIAVAGPSAGACLALALALMARDKTGPKLCYQFLLLPNTDDRFLTPSSQNIIDPRVFNSERYRQVWQGYLGESGADVTAYAAPARAADLSGLPSAYLYVADLDPLRDEGIAYANRLMQAGVSTELHVYPGTHHTSIVHAPEADVTRRTIAEILATFKRVLDQD